MQSGRNFRSGRVHPYLNRQLEMTRRIKDAEAKAINHVFSQLKNIELSINQLDRDIDANNWGSLFGPITPYVALLAYQEGLLSECKLFNTLLFCSAFLEYGQKLEKITYGDERFDQILRATLFYDVASVNEESKKESANPFMLKVKNGLQLHPHQIKLFFDAINELPANERFFFAIDEEIDINKLIKQEEMLDALTMVNFSILFRSQKFYTTLKWLADLNPKYGHAYFGAPLTANVTTMIPSLPLVQIYLKIKFSAQALTINPVLGLSSTNDIQNNIETATRDVALQFPHVRLPPVADTRKARGPSFTLHDIYHVIAASTIPDKHRRLFKELKTLAEEYLLGTVEYNKIGMQIDDILNAMIDLEHPYYRALYSLLECKPKENIETIFLLTLTAWLSNIIPLLSRKTTLALTETLCFYLIAYEKKIADVMTVNYQQIIDCNFPADKKMKSTATQFKETWQHSRAFYLTLFPSRNIDAKKETDVAEVKKLGLKTII